MNNVILLVEDNPTDEKLTRRAFEKSRVANKLIVVHDGAEALEYLLPAEADRATGDHSRPAVVLLDLKLPRVDGLTVLKLLRADERTKLLPIIILTGSREDEDVLKCYALGANAYVRKPVDFDQFVQSVDLLAGFWLGLNEAPPVRGGT